MVRDETEARGFCAKYSIPRARELAFFHVLGSLSPEEAWAFAAHLARGCPFCETEVLCQRRLFAALGRRLPAALPPLYLRRELLFRLRRSPLPWRRGPPLQGPP